MEIAQGIGEPTHPVALACMELYKQGQAVRGKRRPANGGRPFNTYAASAELLAEPEPPPEPRHDQPADQPA